jgi:hypothetical protein
MRRLLLAGLLLAGCGVPEITGPGSRVRVMERSNEAPAGCRMVGTIREAEGGGLRTLEDNRVAVETRLRNEAGRLGANTLAVIDEERGDTDLGALRFSSGVAGMTTPNAGCSNCVLLTAHVFQCDGHKGAGHDGVEVRTAPRPPSDGCDERPAIARPAPPPLPPPPAAQPPPMMPAPAVTVIILPPPQIFLPPPAQPAPRPPPESGEDLH